MSNNGLKGEWVNDEEKRCFADLAKGRTTGAAVTYIGPDNAALT